MNNIPTKPGRYSWIDKKGWLSSPGKVYLLDVLDVNAGYFPESSLRVNWYGSYYNVHPDAWNTPNECWPADGWL